MDGKTCSDKPADQRKVRLQTVLAGVIIRSLPTFLLARQGPPMAKHAPKNFPGSTRGVWIRGRIDQGSANGSHAFEHRGGYRRPTKPANESGQLANQFEGGVSALGIRCLVLAPDQQQ